ncbi:MAG: MmgE/PrpD family protein [Betaproteobacteria bacterium]|nr:MmgE/PrpD family protein [Betaproteobacteria bacterium]MDH3436833.1 MmgE/PrpD family protein [Betaproteobacteria bacterium]
MNAPSAGTSVAESLAERVFALRGEAIPASVRRRTEELLIDVVGLCVAARRTDYVRAVVAAVDAGGPCTAIGHAGGFPAEAAALINGTAAHGEDFDDTFEGGPVHSSAVVIPAALAAAERFQRQGRDALPGIVAGMEVLCRLSMVIPKAIHKAGFHPTSVLGVMGAALAAARTLGLDRRQSVNALGIAGSLASGIIEYLAEGAWTKRMHPGWAAQAGVQAARLAAQGFLGPRTVFEGTHGLFYAFARSLEGNYGVLTEGFGEKWFIDSITFKPYATGTMNQPYIDCALRLGARGVSPEDVNEVLCETAEGYVHRLWEPLASKHRPTNAYAAKFSTPFNVAVAFVTGGAGLSAFTEETAKDPRILALASKVRYVVDPNNPYPKAFTGHVRMTLNDGRVVEERQGHIRGGAQEPLSRAEIEAKFLGNCEYGGWAKGRARRFLDSVPAFFDGSLDLAPLRG